MGAPVGVEGAVSGRGPVTGSPPWLVALVVAVAYAAATLVTVGLFGAVDTAVAFSPAAGIVVAALILVPRGRWVWVLVPAAVVEVTAVLLLGCPAGAALAAAAARTVGPWVGVRLLLARCPTIDLGRRRDMAWFWLFVVVVGSAVAGLIGALALDGTAPYLIDVGHWWGGDAIGALAIGAPLVVLADPANRARLARDGEVVGLGLLVLVAAVVVFWNLSQPVAFVIAPFMLWLGYRRGVPAVAVAAATVAVTANLATASGRGPFADPALAETTRLAIAQLYLAAVILTSWFFAVEVHERELATAAGRADRRARDDLSRIQDLTTRLAATTSLDEVGQVVAAEAPDLLSSAGVGLFAGDEDGLEVVVTTPPLPDAHAYRTVLRDADLPTTHAVRTGQPLFYAHPDDLVDVLPGLVSVLASVGIGSGGALPLRSEGRLVGALALADPTPTPRDAAARSLATTVADQVGQAVGRALLLERERRLRRREAAGRARAELLADVAAALEREVGAGARARAVVDLLVPAFADYASIEQVEDGGGVRILALDHADPARRSVLRELREVHRLADDEAGSVSDVAVRRRAVILGPIDEATMDRFGVAPRARELLLTLGATAHLTVPVGTATTVTGALLIGRSDPARPTFDDDDRALAEEIGWRTGLALENARLYERAQQVALRLQQSLLADSLAPSWDVTCAARYDPAVDELEVGGDWYDVIPLSGGHLGLAVGDVVGRGLEAAATMGRLRTALAAVAADATGPGDALARLDRFARRVTGADCSSCCYLDLDPRTGVLRHASAGHPPALVRDPDGATTFLVDGRSTLLGVGSGSRAEGTVTLRPGSLVLLYSDGLVERRREHLDEGFARLAEVVSSRDDADLDRFCNEVVEALTADRVLRDDVVLLVVRYDGVAPGALRLTFPADPGALAGVRGQLRTWLVESGVADEVGERVLVTVGEACANAAEHAYLGGDGEVELLVHRDGDALEVVVRDRGAWRPHATVTDRGRGTHLMEQLADDFVRRSDGRGTEVRITHRLPGAAVR